MAQAHLHFNQIDLRFEGSNEWILRSFDLTLRPGEFVSIVGRSGCGKSSLIKMAAGLLEPTSGSVEYTILTDQATTRMSYVAQKPALLEWRTVLENVLLPIELQRKVHDRDREQAMNWLGRVGLEGAAALYPHECSGGMLSRAALARAWLTKPRLLLMDEPFAALDVITKRELQQQLAELAHASYATVLYVTHDIAEATALSDRVIVLGGQPATLRGQLHNAEPRPRSSEWIYSAEGAALVRQAMELLERGAAS